MEVHKPLKYFEVYTKEIDEDAKAGISKSSSKLQLVPKDGKKHSSRQPRRVRDKGSSNRKTDDVDAFQDTVAVPISSTKTPLTAETLAQHTAMLPTEHTILPQVAKMQEPVRVPLPAATASVAEEPPQFSTRYANRGPPLPTRLAVPVSFDLFAGPSSPVSAESLSNLAVSETQMDIHLSTLPANDSFRSSPQDTSSTRTRLARSASSSPEHAKASINGAQPVARSETNCAIPRGGSISETTARYFQRNDCPPYPSAKHTSQTSIIPSIDDIIKQHRVPDVLPRPSGSMSSPPVPSIPAKFRSERQKILSIEEIIQRNGQAQAPFRKMGQSAAPDFGSTSRPARSRTVTEDTEVSQARSSIDSVTGEIMQSIKHQNDSQPLRALHHARSQPSLSTPSPARYRDRQTSIFPSSPSESYCSPLPSNEPKILRTVPVSHDEITQYIRSRRLTRLLTLRRSPNHHLVVSFADVGCEDGHPVVVFLGLGSVRYLVALYDELAESLGLRLICIDRWGLGKTGVVSDSRRGFREWASVVEEVLDQLGIDKFSILAHSAGAPYALASSLRLADRVHGSIQLLAPWVGSASESTANAYKWLKFVPSGVIKTAQAAEWKVQGWRLGKLPKLQAQGVGFDPRAPLSSESTASSPVFAEFSVDTSRDEYDDFRSAGAGSPSFPSDSDNDTSLGELANAQAFLSTPTQSRMRKPSFDTSSDLPSIPRTETPPSRLVRKISSSSKATSAASPSVRSYTTTPKSATKLDLGTALMRASHAESLKGGTSDLLTILQKNNKIADFAYAEITRPVRVWHGLKDDKISLQSVMSLETLIPDCKVNVIPGADHSLMTNVAVFVQVLRAIAGEWDNQGRL